MFFCSFSAFTSALALSLTLNHVVETTNQAIEDAPDTNQVNVEKNKGIGTIRDIQPLVVKKPTD
jgi:hypothetical protein